MKTNFDELTSVEALRQECESLLAQVKFQQKAQAQCRKNTLNELRERVFADERFISGISCGDFDAIVYEMLEGG